MKRRILSQIATAVAIGISALWISGCATHVTVRTNPPDASVYARGSGRPAYRWEYRGTVKPNEPVTFDMYYSAMNVFVQWPDGQRSEIRHQDMHFKKDVQMEFTHP